MQHNPGVNRLSFYPYRLRKEYQLLCRTPPTGVSVSLPSDSDLFVWEALFDGPEESSYKGLNSRGRTGLLYNLVANVFCVCARVLLHVGAFVRACSAGP